MKIGILELTLRAGGFQTIAAGAAAVGATSLQLVFDRQGEVQSLLAEGQRLNLGEEAGRQALRDQCAASGLTVSSLLLSNNFNAEDVGAEIDWVCGAAAAAAALGIPALRVDGAMRGDREMPLPERVERFVVALRQILPRTESTGVALGIENHGAAGNDPEFLAGVLGAFDNPRLGLTLDTGNFYWAGNPLSELYRIYERFAPRVKLTHIKSIRYPTTLRDTRREIGYRYGEFASPLDEGDIDFGRVIGLLRGAGYAGDLTIENESLGRYPQPERAGLLRRDADHLRKLLAVQ